MKANPSNRPAPPPATPREEAPGQSLLQQEFGVVSAFVADAVAAWKPALVLFLLSAVLRFWNLGQADMWMDEIFVGKDADSGVFQHVSYVHGAHLRPVGFFLHAFGNTPFWTRFWGALLGTLTVPLLLLLGRSLRSARLGMILGLLALISPYMELYSQDANYYSGMMFYATLQLLGMSMFLQGGRYTGVALAGAVGALSFFNHPFSVLMTGGVVAACGIVSVVLPEIRREMYSLRPADWGRKPAVFLLLLMIGLGAWGATRFSGMITSFLASKFVPGGNYTNIRFGFPFFQYIYTAWGVTYFQITDAARSQAWVPFLVMIAGLVAMVAEARRDRRALVFAAFCILMPVASFAFVFNLNAQRGFYIRYLSYLLPTYLLAIAWVVTAVSDWLGRRLPRVAAVSLAILPVAAVQVPHLLSYLRTDKSNFVTMTGVFAENYKAPEPVLITAGQDDSQVWVYFAPKGLPFRQPEAVNLRPTDLYGNMLADVLPTLFWGQPRVWIINSWRQLRIPDVYQLWDRTLRELFHGSAAQDLDQDAHLFVYEYGKRALLPLSATRFHDDLQNPPSSWMVAGAGEWDVETSPGLAITTDLLAKEEAPGHWHVAAKLPGVLKVTGAGSGGVDVVARPRYPEVQVISPRHQAVLPDHDKHRLEMMDGVETLWRERDGPCEYLLYQAPGAPRHLVLRAFPRETRDLWLAVAVDGVHQGFWSVAQGPQVMQRIVTDIRISPGNHRVSVTGVTPRNDYSPILPWRTAGIEWNAGAPREFSAPVRVDAVPLAWSGALSWGAAGGPPDPSRFMVRSQLNVRVDPGVKGPSGNPALRIDFPSADKSSGAVLLKPFPVTPGRVLCFSLFARARGATLKESLPVHIFLDSSGRPLPVNRYSLHTATTSTHFLGYWRRYVEAVPVPPGAAAVCLGIEFFPREINYHQNEGSAWFDGFAALLGQDQAFADSGPVQGLVWPESSNEPIAP